MWPADWLSWIELALDLAAAPRVVRADPRGALAGDQRATSNVALFSIHVLMMRLHNLVCDVIEVGSRLVNANACNTLRRAVNTQ